MPLDVNVLVCLYNVFRKCILCMMLYSTLVNNIKEKVQHKNDPRFKVVI